MKKNVLYVLRLALTLLIITSVMAAALAGVNAITKDRIAAITKEKTDKAIREVLPNAVYISDPIVSKNLSLPDGVRNLYIGSTQPPADSLPAPQAEKIGYAIEVAPSGFDGEITMMVGVDPEGKVLGISIINHTETAGLGAVAAANSAAGKAFREQFIGMSGELAVSKDGGEVDAITGATITSRAVTEGVNVALAFARTLIAQGY